MFESLSYEEIKQMKNAAFKVLNVAEDAELELSEISPKTGNDAYESFSLTFTSPTEYFFPQNAYLLQHENFGEGEIFIVPVEKTEESYIYEAVFSRFVKS